LTKNQTELDRDLRIGLGIEDFDVAIAQLKTMNVLFSVEPVLTEFGFMAVVTDPDGRKLGLYKN
jgi:lactoylglutathione lyase